MAVFIGISKIKIKKILPSIHSMSLKTVIHTMIAALAGVSCVLLMAYFWPNPDEKALQSKNTEKNNKSHEDTKSSGNKKIPAQNDVLPQDPAGATKGDSSAGSPADNTRDLKNVELHKFSQNSTKSDSIDTLSFSPDNDLQNLSSINNSSTSPNFSKATKTKKSRNQQKKRK